ncbi:MAG: hypothetical protein M3O20_08385 [Acidobacteriota bacterium]|nr:hypothetical protein [Acidobacteriota bacterium]
MGGYRILVVVLSMALPCAAQTTAEEARALAAYPLTMDHVTRHYQALMDLTRQEQEDAGLRREVQGWSGLPLERQIQLYEDNAKTAAILKAHEITPRDQVMTQTALVALMTALPAIEQKKSPNAKNRLQFNASSGEHVKFYHEHQAEIGKLGAELVDVALGKK